MALWYRYRNIIKKQFKTCFQDSVHFRCTLTWWVLTLWSPLEAPWRETGTRPWSTTGWHSSIWSVAFLGQFIKHFMYWFLDLWNKTIFSSISLNTQQKLIHFVVRQEQSWMWNHPFIFVCFQITYVMKFGWNLQRVEEQSRARIISGNNGSNNHNHQQHPHPPHYHHHQ